MASMMAQPFRKKWFLVLKIVPIVVFVLGIKLFSHSFGYEIIALNALYTSLVAGTIFLLGFLISGVLSDYKESEKIPSELSASLESLHDESYTIYKGKKSKVAKAFIEYQNSFVGSLIGWFYKKEKTKSILQKIKGMNDFFVEFEKEGVQAGFLVKMKNEQSNIRKLVLRTHTIRDTEFISSAYTIVEILAFFVTFGIIITKIEPFYESLFFTAIVTFLVFYMIFLIKDLDNPFEYSEHGENGTEVPLKPLHDLDFSLKNS